MSDLTPAMVRDYMQANDTTGVAGQTAKQWSDGTIGSNIAAARGFIERQTHRQFEPQGSNTVVTKTFSTRGRTFLRLPGLQRGSNTTVTLNGSTLTENETFWFIPDSRMDGVFVAIQLPGLRDSQNYRSFSNWFDNNYDSWWWRGRLWERPNDLEIASAWGHYPYPAEFLLAWKAAAAYLTIRPDALLSGARQTPDGNVFDLSRWPNEVQSFVRDWELKEFD